MAEVLGATASVLTLAGVFKICIEAFELIRACKNHEAEVKKLMLKLKIEKCRLLVWGQSMGLVAEAEAKTPMALEDCPFADLVRETLESLLDLFRNTDGLSGKYGCRKIAVSEEPLDLGHTLPTPSERLNSAFSKIQIRSNKAKEVTRRARWAIHDKKRFEVLVRDTKELIDGLQDITKGLATQRKQERNFSLRISTINDPETLQMISEVCESDHPAFSDAASFRADAITLELSGKQDILQWLHDADPEPEIDGHYHSIEDWDLKEMRRRYMALLNTGIGRGLLDEGLSESIAGLEPRLRYVTEQRAEQEVLQDLTARGAEEGKQQRLLEDVDPQAWSSMTTSITKEEKAVYVAKSDNSPPKERLQTPMASTRARLPFEFSSAGLVDLTLRKLQEERDFYRCERDIMRKFTSRRLGWAQLPPRPPSPQTRQYAHERPQSNQIGVGPKITSKMTPESRLNIMRTAISKAMLTLKTSENAKAEDINRSEFAKPPAGSLLASWVDNAFQVPREHADSPSQQIAALHLGRSLVRCIRQLRYIEQAAQPPSNPYAARLYRTASLADDASSRNTGGGASATICDSQTWAFIKEMDVMGFGPSNIDLALRAADWDTERALKYLLSGIPADAILREKRVYLPQALRSQAASSSLLSPVAIPEPAVVGWK